MLYTQETVRAAGYSPDLVVVPPGDALAIQLVMVTSGDHYAFAQMMPRFVVSTAVSTVPRKGYPNSWLAILAALALVVVVVSTAFAIGRTSAPHASVNIGTQGGLGPQLTHMAPWMQDHAGDIAWMQGHMGDVAWIQHHGSDLAWMQHHAGEIKWMQLHANRWRWIQGHAGDLKWMQAHPVEWRWIQTHMGDIGWMHDHWGQWTGWQSSAGYGSGQGSSGSGGWQCGKWC